MNNNCCIDIGQDQEKETDLTREPGVGFVVSESGTVQCETSRAITLIVPFRAIRSLLSEKPLTRPKRGLMPITPETAIILDDDIAGIVDRSRKRFRNDEMQDHD